MTTVIHPTDIPVAFPASDGWHRDGRDVTLYAVQVLTAYRLIRLSLKGMGFRPASNPVRFLNQAFDRKWSAARWQELLEPVVEQIHECIEFRSQHPDNCLTAD